MNCLTDRELLALFAVAFGAGIALGFCVAGAIAMHRHL